MPDNPEPQNPKQPSPAPSESSQPTPPPAGSKMDWRLIVIVGIAVLFLIAVYANKAWYSKAPAESPAEPSKESAAKPETAPPAPPMSPKERYAMMLRASEMEIQGEMFREGGRTLLLALPAVPASSKENAKEPDMVIPGTLFDVTKMADGVKPAMLQRRTIYANQVQALFMDMFPPLGMDEHLGMVIQPAASATPEMIGETQPVVCVKIGDDARAYPVKLMNYHDVINDTLGGERIVVVWSALAVAPSAMYRDQLTFGSAGLIYQGAIVIYSKDSLPTADGKKADAFSLWSPTLRLCIAGERAGARLRPLQADLLAWKTWKTLNPKTTVVTGTKPALPYINYGVNLAAPPDYLNPNNPQFQHPVYGLDVEKNPLMPKARVFGITDSEGKAAKAYLVNFLAEKTAPFEDKVGDRKVTLHFDQNTLMLSATDAEGKPVLTEGMFWIAWLGAHPKTELWQEDRLRALRAGQNVSPPAEASTPATTTAPVPAVTTESAPAATTSAPATTTSAPAATTSMPATTGAPAGTAR